MKYLVIYEESAEGWSAYSPDLPGLVAEGKTLDEVKDVISHTMQFYLSGMRREGDRMPPASPAAEFTSMDAHA